MAKPRRRRLSRVLVSLAAIVLTVGGFMVAAALYASTTFHAPGPLAEERIFEVSRGMSTPAIARELKQAGVISDDKVFLAAAYLTRTYRRMKAGEYLFPKGASMAEVMAAITSGRALVHKVTVPEGFTTAQVIERVSAHETLIGDISDIPPEGAILPETYVFRRGMTRDALLKEMQAAQQKLIEEMWAKRASGLPFTTREEALILASIVEKETAIAAERPLVAAVFINRLRRGMRLQSDPTIIYGITRGKTKLERPILKSDIEALTPYNTYRINGLPPTPIANPGRESIAAVLNPIDSDHLYFVADGSGGHVFAETLEEHRSNVRKWRAVERSLTAEAEALPREIAAQAPAPVEAPKALAAEPKQAVPAERAAAAESRPAVNAEAAAPVAPEAPAAEAAPPAEAQAPPLPAPKPQEAQADEDPRAGTLVVVAGRLVPIPAKRPRRN